MSNKENRTDIAEEETVGRDSSKHILKRLENSEIRQQEKLDKIAKTFKSGLTGFTETIIDIFKERAIVNKRVIVNKFCQQKNSWDNFKDGL